MKGRHSAANTQTPFSSRLVFSVLVCCRRCAEPDADSYRRLDQFSHMVSVVCGLEKGAVPRTGSRAIAGVYAGTDFFGGVGIQADRLYHANRLCDYGDLAWIA